MRDEIFDNLVKKCNESGGMLFHRPSPDGCYYCQLGYPDVEPGYCEHAGEFVRNAWGQDRYSCVVKK